MSAGRVGGRTGVFGFVARSVPAAVFTSVLDINIGGGVSTLVKGGIVGGCGGLISTNSSIHTILVSLVGLQSNSLT